MNSKMSTAVSSGSRAATDRETAAAYIRANFQPEDRLAVVLSSKGTQDVVQRIASAEKIAAQDFQAWLRFQNSRRYEVYISMNALAAGARGRTKADIETIRHLYLDFDEGGTKAVERLLASDDLPEPNYLLNTSPDKWQAVWKVQGFTKGEAEDVQRMLVQEFGADPAATDCSRVLRLPGFYNHKYAEPFWITSQELSKEIYGRERFPEVAPDTSSRRISEPGSEQPGGKRPPAAISQSERDWAYARRALERGDSEDRVIAAIAVYRRFDKHDPDDYARRTVRKAVESLSREMPRPETHNSEPER